MGGGITWTINESYDYTHKIQYIFGNTNGWLLGSSSAASNTSSGTWTVPTALANQIPNATSGSGTIYLYTYYGGVYVGVKSYTFTAKVPNDTTWQPTIPNVTISDAGYRPTGISSYVQGKAKANVVSSSAAQGGASIKSYRVIVSDIGTYYGGNITSGFLTKSGTVTVTVRATDSRGYYREKESTITVVPYSPPKLTTYTASRSPNDQGANLATSINFSISSVNNQNVKQYSIRYRPSGGEWVSLAYSTDYYSRNTTHSATGVLDVNSPYEVEFYIKDSYTTVIQTRNIGTAFQLLDFNANGRGVAFGKVSEKSKFEVGMPAEFSPDFTMPNGRLAVYLGSTSDLNDVVEEWVIGENGSNYPGTGFWYVNTIMFENLSQRKQIAYGYQNNDVFTRYRYGGTWSTWVNTNGVTGNSSTTNERYEQTALAIKLIAPTFSDEVLTQIPLLFDEWAAGVDYVTDKSVVRFEDNLYRVITSHRSQSDWLPPDVPALYKRIEPPNTIGAWVQPLGEHDAYQMGDKVTHKDKTWVSTANDNVWEPGVYGWEITT
jgi:hypothetical protein